jgi:hypothetical protein
MKNEIHVTRRGDGTRQTLNAASTSTAQYNQKNINDLQAVLDALCLRNAVR